MRATLATALVPLVLGCGGKAFKDGAPGAGGAGGSGGADPAVTSGGGSPLCATPSPVGTIVLCGGSGTSGPGGPSSCSALACDDVGNVWESRCSGQSCACLFNGESRCSCVLNEPGLEFCSPGINACCPAPFPK